MMRVELVRHLEQHAALVPVAGLPGSASPRRHSGRRGRAPRHCSASAFSQRSTWSAKRSSVSSPPIAARARARSAGAVECRRLLRAVSSWPRGAARTAASRVERRQLLVARLQRAHLGGDAEQLADEVLEMGRELDDQVGFRLAVDLVRRGARAPSAGRADRDCAPRAKSTKRRVEPHQAVAAIKVREPQVETEAVQEVDVMYS